MDKLNYEQWKALAVIVFVGLSAICVGLISEWRTGRNRLRQSVFDNLDNAYQNGHFEPCEQLYGMSPDEIAYDMTCYGVDFEDMRAPTLTPYVRAWLRQKGL